MTQENFSGCIIGGVIVSIAIGVKTHSLPNFFICMGLSVIFCSIVPEIFKSRK
jgi:hypothetical protein